VHIDTLVLDLNGIFHPAAQKVFKYGKNEETGKRLLPRRQAPLSRRDLERNTFKEVGKMISELVDKVQPRKRLLLCVDGVAGCSKCVQQRSRRFKSAKERDEKAKESGGAESDRCPFDSACITPGTVFMDKLNRYIDWYARAQIQSNPRWRNLDVVFSNEKVPGEGEHKGLQMMKRYCDPEETFCIYGLDADLIMLCLALQRPNVYVYRDNAYKESERFIINIGLFAKRIKKDLGTDTAIQDFIFMCFMVGNDFLPQLPGLEIINQGIERLLSVYRETCRPFGLVAPHTFRIRIDALMRYLRALSSVEEQALKDKYKIRHKFNKDELMEQHFYYDLTQEQKGGGRIVGCRFAEFKEAYYAKKLSGIPVKSVCHEYLKGLHWIILYYMDKIPSWTWNYPYHYGPFIDDLSTCGDYTFRPFAPSTALLPFQQLLAVLPPQSSGLLPPVLAKLMTDAHSPLIGYYPTEFSVDLSGKRAEWEGIALLPMIIFPDLKEFYNKTASMIDAREKRRNAHQLSVRYIRTEERPFTLRSEFGDLRKCIIRTLPFEYME